MKPGRIYVLSGDGRGKTSAAIGYSIKAAGEGKDVVFIQFLKGKTGEELEILKRLEPEIRLFAFEKSEEAYLELEEAQKQEEISNIRNGFAFARKILTTGDCDLLVLDEVLGLLDVGVVTEEEIMQLLSCRPDEVSIIMTGINVSEKLAGLADRHTVFVREK